MSYKFFCPTRVLFGSGQLSRLHRQPMPGRKALLVISNGSSARTGGALARTQDQLELAGVQWVLFDQIGSNPTKSAVETGARLAREQSCDFVVALGGGSVIDAAKIIAMHALQPGDLWDYVNCMASKAQPLVNPTLPIIAITTTAGTGSEVDQWAVISNPDTNEKLCCGGMDSLFPVIAVVDPELMLSVPPKFTAYQGFDALFHSVEGYISNAGSLMSDMIQLTAVEHIAANLPLAVKDGSNLQARERLAFANTLSGYSMVLCGCTSEHAMEHAMSAYHPDLPHGAGLLMISREYYAHFISLHCCDDRFVRLAQVMGMSDASTPSDFLTALEQLKAACGVSGLRMSDYGIRKEDAIILAHNARATTPGQFARDRVPLTDEQCAAIFERSWL